VLHMLMKVSMDVIWGKCCDADMTRACSWCVCRSSLPRFFQAWPDWDEDRAYCMKRSLLCFVCDG